MAIQAILLGTAQDAGLPQAGCFCVNCRWAYLDPQRRRYTVCLGLIDFDRHQSWLIDATPDFREQLHLLHACAPDCPLAGIILTHAHVGHYAGLIHCGSEAMNSHQLPLYGTPAMLDFLSHHQPWASLFSREHVRAHPINPKESINLTPHLELTAIPVPHRDEFSDTMAYVVKGKQRSLFFCPDIDAWDVWDEPLRPFLNRMDIALLDASFYSEAELPGRDISQIPHPLVTDTVARLQGVECAVYLTHLNHTNPLHRAGAERTWVYERGVLVGQQGQQWSLG